MATLLLCDHTHGDQFLVTYLSDPVLTIASAKLWYKTQNKVDKLLVTRALPVLRQKLVHGAVVEGYVGELVGRLLLLLGMDSTNMTDEGIVGYDGGWCKVSDFMKCCFGITGCLEGQDAYVGFSHFIPLVKEPATYKELQELLYRRAACSLPPRRTGVDLLIPFWKKTKTGPLISYMLIQVKNCQRKQDGDKMLFKLNPKVCFLEGNELRQPTTDIVLMMEIGMNYKTFPFPESERKDPPGAKERWKKWVYSVRGINSNVYPFLDDQNMLRNELLRLRKASLNLKDWMEVDDNDEITGTPPSPKSPQVDRKRHIRRIRPKIMMDEEDDMVDE